eukprot:CAMPEP_0173099814 /NCGR_PEP_ID=MMETSP1102-20130122/35758_1 /TAXON_ID=49646 /ORGANISM="Geminigera sp., Strain Caron Lab Isolate" /LENGTH=41 /DNA_ID= /DNA_START= /DNA_END= /DNA_ORIENTATION=
MARGAHECDDLALTSIFCFQTLEACANSSGVGMVEGRDMSV